MAVAVVAPCGGNLYERKVTDGRGDAPDAPPAKSSPDGRMYAAEQQRVDDPAAFAGNGAFAVLVPTMAVGFTD